MQEASSPVIKLHEDDSAAVDFMLHFIYRSNTICYDESLFSDQYEGPMEFSVALFALGETYFVPSLQKAVLDYFDYLVHGSDCDGSDSHIFNVADFAAAVERAYCTSDPDRILREAVIAATLKLRNEVFPAKDVDEQVIEVANTYPEYCADILAARVTNEPDKATVQLWEQPPFTHLHPPKEPDEEQLENFARRKETVEDISRELGTAFCNLVHFPEYDRRMSDDEVVDLFKSANSLVSVLDTFDPALESSLIRATYIDSRLEGIVMEEDIYARVGEMAAPQKRCEALSDRYRKLVNADKQSSKDRVTEQRLLAAVRGEWASPGGDVPDVESIADRGEVKADREDGEGGGEKAGGGQDTEAQSLGLEELALE